MHIVLYLYTRQIHAWGVVFFYVYTIPRTSLSTVEIAIYLQRTSYHWIWHYGHRGSLNQRHPQIHYMYTAMFPLKPFQWTHAYFRVQEFIYTQTHVTWQQRPLFADGDSVVPGAKTRPLSLSNERFAEFFFYTRRRVPWKIYWAISVSVHDDNGRTIGSNVVLRYNLTGMISSARLKLWGGGVFRKLAHWYLRS